MIEALARLGTGSALSIAFEVADNVLLHGSTTAP